MGRERQIQPALTVDENQSSLTPLIIDFVYFGGPIDFCLQLGWQSRDQIG
jgi:hypothetical protein